MSCNGCGHQYHLLRYTETQSTTDMSSLRVLLCDLCLILCFGLHIVLAEDNSVTNLAEIPKGNCSCGGFPTETPETDAAPLLSQTPGLVVQCDAEGDSTCKSLCNALATATKAKGPDVLCNRLKVAQELKLSAFYKVCEKPWMFANMTAEEPLCCDDSKSVACPPGERVNATNIVDAKILI